LVLFYPGGPRLELFGTRKNKSLKREKDKRNTLKEIKRGFSYRKGGDRGNDKSTTKWEKKELSS